MRPTDIYFMKGALALILGCLYADAFLSVVANLIAVLFFGASLFACRK